MDQMEVVNLVPKFLDFYERADTAGIDPDQRWALWEEFYRFAAVPPGDEGEKLARRLLDEAWPKYHQHLGYIKDWKSDESELTQKLTEIKSLLGCEEPIRLVVLYFVGGFENNAFVAPYDGERLALCLPIENGDSSILLAHELTHIVHSKKANLTANWERTIGSTVLQEGLAMHVSKMIVPGEKDESYTEHTTGWLESCQSKREEILKGIIPYLDDSSSESVTKFTFGKGTTGTEREAYFAGWEVVQSLLDKGKTLAELAEIEEADIPDFLRRELIRLVV